MSKAKKTIEFKFERIISASPEEVFDAWLNPEVPGTTWHEADKLLLNPQVDGFFYWLIRDIAHYGRFTELQRPKQIQLTWMSRTTHGLETMVTVTFAERGEDTVMTLTHTGLPDSDEGLGHERGWTYFLDRFTGELGGRGQKK